MQNLKTPLFGARLWVTRLRWNFAESFGARKIDPLGNRMALFA